MKKALFPIILVLVIFFISFYSYEKKQTTKNTDTTQDEAYIENLGDSTISADELTKKIANKEDITVFFYSPTCTACKEALPIATEAAIENDMIVSYMNVIDNQDAWANFELSSTPTIVKYLKGEEAGRIEGLHTIETYNEWFGLWK